MRCRLDTAYTDARAAALAWDLGGPLRLALATMTVPVPGGVVELRVLGGSHQVAVTLGGTSCSETVACGGTPPGLPAVSERALPGLRYRFRSRVERLAPDVLARRAEVVLHRIGDDRRGLVGMFPGSPHALTALLVRAPAGGVAWRTWHLYPQAGEVVVTTSQVQRR
ncbi:MAG: DUF2617 family protein [Acidimicrobiia bacterium]